jgi:hypothetical protein
MPAGRSLRSRLLHRMLDNPAWESRMRYARMNPSALKRPSLQTGLTPHSKPILATIGILFLIGYTIDYNSQYLPLRSLASADIRLFAIAPSR